MTVQHDERDQARAELRELIKSGDTIYTILRHVSRSGMSRIIDCHIITPAGIKWIGRYVARAIGCAYTEKNGGGLHVGGCGMDMGFSIVNSLSYALYHEYQCIGENCRAADHVNRRGNYNELPAYPRDGKMKHKDGYALNQKWL